MTTKEKPKAEQLAEEERTMDEEIERLEVEARELEAPGRALTWDEIVAGEDPDKRERRRGVLPRLITAAKVKRLELRRERYADELEPLQAKLREAHARLEKATERRLKAIKEEGVARADYGDAFTRGQRLEQRIKDIDRETRELRGEG